jgi:deoxyribonuclease-1
MKKCSLFLIIFSFTFFVYADTPSSFSKAKRLLYKEIYKNHNETFYCGCKYTNNEDVYTKKLVDVKNCDYEVKSNKRRGYGVEAEHIVPAYWIANLTEKGRECWAKGTKLKGTNGRKYCKKNNPEFKQAYTDLMNLVPAVGEINGDRDMARFFIIDGEERKYGACDFEVKRVGDRTNWTAEPPQNVRGDIARIYFYMKNRYGLEFSDKTLNLMNQWNELDPISDWEKERIKRIQKIQNN